MRVAGVLHIFQFETKQGEDICMALQVGAGVDAFACCGAWGRLWWCSVLLGECAGLALLVKRLTVALT